jgi:hypothetical protein
MPGAYSQCSTDPLSIPAIPPPLRGGCAKTRTLPRVALRSTRGYNPSPRWGERKPPLRGGCAETRTLPRVAHRPLCSGRCSTRGYNPPPRWGGSM